MISYHKISLLISLVTATLLPLALYTQPIYISIDAVGANNGSSWTNAYRDLQDALAVATDGDELWIKGGAYTPTVGTDRTISFEIDQNIKLYGGFAGTETSIEERNIDDNPTILSGEIDGGNNAGNSHLVVRVALRDSFLMDGIDVFDGTGNGSGEHGAGIKVVCEQNSGKSVIGFKHCFFTKNLNVSMAGGGMVLEAYNNADIEMSMTDCRFDFNTANLGGGHYFIGRNEAKVKMRFSNCVWNSNVANTNISGAGHFSTAGGSVFDISFIGCTINDNFAGAWNGGFAFYASGSENHTAHNISIDRCQFISNTGRLGSSVIITVPDDPQINIDIRNSIFERNKALDGIGGVIGIDGGFNQTGGTLCNIVNCIFNNNSVSGGKGGAISVTGSRTNDPDEGIADLNITNTLFFNNLADQGGNIIYGQKMKEGQDRIFISNSILWNKLPNVSQIFDLDDGKITITHSLVPNEFCNEMATGTGNFSVECLNGMIYKQVPLFVDLDGEDFHLKEDSPCINAGDNQYVQTIYDLDGKDRIIVDTIDMGPYEYGICNVWRSDTIYTCDADHPPLVIDTIAGIPFNACDTVLAITFTWVPFDTTSIIDTTCVLEEAGLFIDTINAIDGCDSLVYTNRIYSPLPETEIIFYTCDESLADYVDTLYSNIGCDSVVSIRFESPKEPLEITFPPIINSAIGEKYHISILSNRDSIHVSWDPNLSLECEVCAEQVITITVDQDLAFTATDEFGCSFQGVIQLRTIKSDLFIPNIFSPNGDGINESIAPQFNPATGNTITSMEVFDRWGNLVYRTQGSNPSWDGRDVLPGVYVVKVLYKTPSDGEKVIMQDITLLR